MTRNERAPTRAWLLWPILGCATLGLAPIAPEPHVWGKLRWVMGGAAGMGPVDWFDLVMHLSPWIWLAAALALRLRSNSAARS